MATAKVLTGADWDARAVELAEAHGLADGAACELARVEYAAYDRDGYGLDGTEFYLLPSSSDPRGWHLVSHHMRSGRVRCDCTAASYGRPCGHVGAVLLLLARRRVALAAWLRATGRQAA